MRKEKENLIGRIHPGGYPGNGVNYGEFGVCEEGTEKGDLGDFL